MKSITLTSAVAVAVLAATGLSAASLKSDAFDHSLGKPAVDQKAAYQAKLGLTPVYLDPLDANLSQALALRDKVMANWQPGDDGFAWAEASTQVALAERAALNAPAIRFVSQPVIQPVAAARTGAYPLCRNDRDDSCMNAPLGASDKGRELS